MLSNAEQYIFHYPEPPRVTEASIEKEIDWLERRLAALRATRAETAVAA